LPSDFNYEKQALLFIPQDLWNIKDNLSEILSFLEKFFEKVKGRTLVLFTAFVVIREVFSQLKNKLQQKEIYLLAQSISGSKYKQIDFFRKNPNSSILLWTDTFWEGIDIPWEDLQYLIIHKIPFQVPSDPIFQARSRLFQNSFEQYAIPKATLKLKQWFGRLIRTKKDTGIVVFLDERVLNTSWGIKLLDAFPKDIKRRVWESQKLLDIL
jgi:Rad3-related DNA helicase